MDKLQLSKSSCAQEQRKRIYLAMSYIHVTFSLCNLAGQKVIFTSHLKSNVVQRSIKLQLYRNLISPVLPYG